MREAKRNLGVLLLLFSGVVLVLLPKKREGAAGIGEDRVSCCCCCCQGRLLSRLGLQGARGLKLVCCWWCVGETEEARMGEEESGEE